MTDYLLFVSLIVTLVALDVLTGLIYSFASELRGFALGLSRFDRRTLLAGLVLFSFVLVLAAAPLLWAFVGRPVAIEAFRSQVAIAVAMYVGAKRPFREYVARQAAKRGIEIHEVARTE